MRSVARRKHALSAISCLVSALVAADAAAAPPAATRPPPGGPKQSSAQFTLHKDEAGGADAALARNRARAGDCAGALPAFDAAIRNTIEPSLRRDRGLCHEKLGHPYPAMDDYRTYLTARPEANDSDEIRQRLARLEEQTGQGGPSAQAMKEGGEGEGASASASAEASTGGGKAEASASTSMSLSAGKGKLRDAPTTTERNYDDYVAQEKLADSAESSPLRYGEGWVVGPFVNVPRYFFDSGSTSDMAYAVGARFGYSTSSSMMLVAELGYAGIGKGGAATSLSGPLALLGAELRLAISRYATDQILLGGGLGFERYVESGTRIGADFIPLRLKLGLRHVFGPSVAIEGAIDGGPAYVIPDSNGGSNKRFIGTLGGSFAVLIGF